MLLFFQISGFTLMSLGALLLADDERILLSRLLGPGDIHPDQPLFYYLAFALVGLGFLITLTGLLGCWAICLYNRCITISVRIYKFLLLYVIKHFEQFPNVYNFLLFFNTFLCNSCLNKLRIKIRIMNWNSKHVTELQIIVYLQKKYPQCKIVLESRNFYSNIVYLKRNKLQ